MLRGNQLQRKSGEAMKRCHRLGCAILAGVASFSGCASFDGRGLQPGVASEADVRQLMGAPAAVWPEASGGSLLSYPRGPMGLQTYMVRIDANGRLAALEQALDKTHFDRVRRGMSKDDVGRLIGPPGTSKAFQKPDLIFWEYRYRDVWDYVSIFSVIFGPDGRVDSTMSLREDRPDMGK
jgi:outer membrane protein assembly factor BamE (lipoprotein component of BamABCDE complex)